MANASIVHLFASGGEKKKKKKVKYHKTTAFWCYPQRVYLSLNEAKLTIENVFIVDPFPLRGEKSHPFKPSTMS